MLIPFGSQSYQHESSQLSSQRMVNCFLEKQAEGSKSPIAVIRTPGIETVTTLPKTPIRGGLEHKGVAYFVSGDGLYSVNNGSYVYIGEIPGSDRVKMISNGSQLGILSAQDLYVYETTLAKVTDPGFGGAIDMTYSDLFGVFVSPDSADFFISNPGAVPFPDLTDYDALDSATAEAQPGNIVAIGTDHRELIVFKEKHGEIWANTGNADFTFQAVPNAFIELGCIARDSLAKADNTIYWLANDMTVRKLNGYTPVRVSTHAIENIITKMSARSDAVAFTHPFNGHLFYVLTFPVENRTFVLDITTGLWHERETDGKEWRANSYVYAGDTHYVGDSLTGKIGQLSGTEYTDFGDVHRVEVISPPIHKDGAQLFFKRLHIDFEMGAGLATGQGSDPQVMLQWSDDGGKTWSSEYWRSIGKVGQYSNRAVWHRLGSSNSRVFKLTFSDPSPFTMIQAIADVELGNT